jgi:putative ATP-binding cassette transporter
MGLICEELKEATILSVAHRPELEAFHSRKIVLARRERGARLVADIPLARWPGRFMLIPGWFRRRNVESKAGAARRGHLP